MEAIASAVGPLFYTDLVGSCDGSAADPNMEGRFGDNTDESGDRARRFAFDAEHR